MKGNQEQSLANVTDLGDVWKGSLSSEPQETIFDVDGGNNQVSRFVYESQATN